MNTLTPPTTNLPKYKTTRPILPPISSRQPITTPISPSLTLQLRPHDPSDLHHAHRLRTQQAVMVNTSTGIVDADLPTTQIWLNRFLSPNDATTYNFAMWVKPITTNEWEHIGTMGVHITSPVCHIGYMLRTEWWGKSVASVSVKAFLKSWWELEREEVVVNLADARDEHDLHIMKLEMDESVHDSSSEHSEIKVVSEILLAEIEENNRGSLRVVEKCGFVHVASESVVEDAGTFTLLDYALSRTT